VIEILSPLLLECVVAVEVDASLGPFEGSFEISCLDLPNTGLPVGVDQRQPAELREKRSANARLKLDVMRKGHTVELRERFGKLVS
jgi:hypothetical protein